MSDAENCPHPATRLYSRSASSLWDLMYELLWYVDDAKGSGIVVGCCECGDILRQAPERNGETP